MPLKVDAPTEQISITVTLYACIQEILCPNLGRDIDDPDVLHDLPQSLHENSETGSR
jgi:hypothetical protein